MLPFTVVIFIEQLFFVYVTNTVFCEECEESKSYVMLPINLTFSLCVGHWCIRYRIRIWIGRIEKGQ